MTAERYRMTNKAKELVAGSRSYEMRFVMLPRFDMATLATMIEPLRIANYLTGGAVSLGVFDASCSTGILAVRSFSSTDS